MYGEGKNLNIGKNKSVKEMLNNIPNNTNEQNNESNMITNSSKNFHLETKLESISSSITSPFKMIYIIVLLLLFTILGFIYYYKDIMLQYITSLTSNEKVNTATVDTSKVDTNAKMDDASAKVDTNAKMDNTSAKIDVLENKIDKLSKDCPVNPAVGTLNNKINKVASYGKNVTENSFCYIGYDNGQRECVDVYAGDVCMSGEIFPSLDICINPKLRA